MKAFRLILPGLVIASIVLVIGELSSSILGDGSVSRGQRGPKSDSADITIEANGDLLIHSPVFNQALSDGGGHVYDFNPMLRYIKPFVMAADLSVCHVEVPMTSAQPAGYPLFNSPPGLANAIRSTGWKACDTASNHTLDRGQDGVDQTIANLDRAGVRHTGSWSSAVGRQRPLILDVKGVKVAWLAYTEMTNGIPPPNPWTVGLASAPAILADARAARRLGAEAVIVNIHGGDEYQHDPSSFQISLAQKLTASPLITALVGQHVHVVQPIRWLNGKPVVYGEGNLLSNQTVNCCPAASQDGYMALLHMHVADGRASVRSVDYVPVWVRHPDFVVLPITKALRQGLAPAGELRQSWERTTSVVGRSATIRPL